MTFLWTHWRWRLSVLCIYITVDVWQSNILIPVAKHKILSLNLSKTRGRNRWFMKLRSNQRSHFHKCCWHWQHNQNRNCIHCLWRGLTVVRNIDIFFGPQIMTTNIVMIGFIRSPTTVQRSNDCLKIARKWAPNNLHPFQTMILTEIKYHLWKHLLFLVT